MATSRPFAYNLGSSIPGTQQVGNISIGTPTSGFSSTGLQWWNGPDEDLGYIICRPVPSNTHPTPVRNSWNTNNVGVGNTLSNNNLTVTNSGVLSSVISTKLVSGSKSMFSIKIEQSVTSAYIGFAKNSMNINSYVGSNDGNSIGFGSDGNYYYYGSVQASNLPLWGNSGDIVDICIDLINNKIFIRVNGGNWNGILNEDPTSGAGSIGTAGLESLYPALTVYNGSASLLSQKTEIGGYYSLKVGSFTSILGNNTLEDDLINYAVCQGFNIIQLYDLYTIFDSPSLSNLLDEFLTKVYNYKLLPVAIMGSGTAGFDLVNNWEQTPGRINQFWGVNKENEFWWYGTPQGPESETFINWINSMNYVRTTYPHWHRSAYIANPANTWGLSEAQDMIDAQIDVLEVTNYNSGAPDANWTAFKNNQLLNLASAADSSNVIQKIVPLWSSDAVDSGPYFGGNGLPTSASLYNVDYDTLSFTNKSKLNKIGFSIFMYSSLSSYVPTCPVLNIIPTGYTFLGKTLASVSFLKSKIRSELSFLNLVNSRFNQSFVTGDAAQYWLNTNGYWTSWSYNESLIKLYLDAGNINSYSGTGPTWYDLLGSKDGELRNGVTYSSGYFDFDGVNDYVSLSLVTNQVSNVTLEAWFNSDNVNQAGQMILYNGSDLNTNGYGFAVNNESTSDGHLRVLYGAVAWIDTGFTLSSNTWYQAVMTINGNSLVVYVNGIQVFSTTTSIPNTPTLYTNIGRNDFPAARYFNGKISICKIWERTLSASDVLLEWNEYKHRYGY